MFRRNIMDKTGLEPSQLFSVVQFLMYDKAFTGFVTLDQTMQMLVSSWERRANEASEGAFLWWLTRY